MTQAAEGTRVAAVPRVGPAPTPERAWFWASAALIAAAHVVKYPALHHYVLANAGQGPELDELPPDMVATALAVGSGMGLALSLMLSLVALAIVRWLGTRSRPAERAGRIFPFWLSGVGTMGLTVPDLITAATGTIHPWTTLPFLVYPAVILAACWLAPAPRRARFRLADLALAGVLTLV